MKIKFFSISKLNEMRRVACETEMLPFDEHPKGWSKCLNDPMRLFEAFSSIKIKSGCVLRAYHHNSSIRGWSTVWALPQSADFPEPVFDAEAYLKSGDRDAPSQPIPPSFIRSELPDELSNGNLDISIELLEKNFISSKHPEPDAMPVVVGDGSAFSYISASLFKRQAQGKDWNFHHLIGRDPWKTIPKKGNEYLTPSYPVEKWRWTNLRPVNWKPCVQMDSKCAIVSFYTFSRYSEETITHHMDLYRKGNYQFLSRETVIAVGGDGFII